MSLRESVATAAISFFTGQKKTKIKKQNNISLAGRRTERGYPDFYIGRTEEN